MKIAVPVSIPRHTLDDFTVTEIARIEHDTTLGSLLYVDDFSRSPLESEGVSGVGD
jgi:hypothetical protein